MMAHHLAARPQCMETWRQDPINSTSLSLICVFEVVYAKDCCGQLGMILT